MLTKKFIKEITDSIVNKFHPYKIILFGSYAGGHPTEDSDLDLLIVMDSDLPRYKRARAIRESLRDFCFSKDIIVHTPAEVEKYKDLIGTIIYPAMRYGKVIYER